MTIGAKARMTSSLPNGSALVEELTKTSAAHNVEIRNQRRESTTKVYPFAVALFFAASAAAQAPVPITPFQVFNFNPQTGQVQACAGCSVETFIAGTNTHSPTYTNSSLMVQNTNPVLTNSQGYAAGADGSTITGIWVGAVCLKVVTKDINLVTVYTQDNVCDQGLVLKALLGGITGAAQIGFEQSGGNLITMGGAISSLGTYDRGYTTLAGGCNNTVSGSSLLITQEWSAVPAQSLNCNAYFFPGGIIQPGASQVVTFASMPTLPALRQYFDTSLGGPGSILFPTGPNPVGPVSPEWFGASCAAVSGMTDGTTNLAAFTAAQRALPQWPNTNPQGLFINVGKLQLGGCGVNSYGYPLSATFSLSPHTTFSGVPTGASVVYAPSTGFTGAYAFNVINENGSGQPPNSNFSTGLTDLLIDMAQHTTSVIGGVQWGVALHSKLSDLTVYTRGIGFNVPSMDGSTGTSLETDIYNVTCSDTRLMGQGMVIASNPAVTLTNKLETLKFVYFGAFGADPALSGACHSGGTPVGFIPGALPALDIGDVDGLIVDGANFENVPYPFTIGPGSNSVRLSAFKAFLDCGTGCPLNGGCPTISSLAYNAHVDGTLNHMLGLCIGEHWMPLTPYSSTGGFPTTVIDAYGCIQKATTGGTSGSVVPVWPGSGASCTGTTSDGSVTWTAQGMVSIACSPQIQTAATYIYANNGQQQNCYIPSISSQNTSPQGGYLTPSGGPGAASTADNTTFSYSYDAATFWQSATPQIVTLKGANFNTTSDQLVYVNFPVGFTRFTVNSVTMSNSSIALDTAVGGVYSAAGKTGCLIVAPGQHWQVPGTGPGNYSVSATIDVAGGSASCLNYNTAGSTTYNASVFISRASGFFYLSLTTPQGAPATADLTFGLTFQP